MITRWQVRTYDVWGNARDGWNVNDSYDAGETELELSVTTHNEGMGNQFQSATLSDEQISELFGGEIETDGDDVTIYVNRSSDGYPLGELHCVSHDSLSPIRENLG